MHRSSTPAWGPAALVRIMVAVLMLPLAGLAATPAAADTIQLVPIANGFMQPLFVTGAGTGSDRLFVVEKPGRIRVVKEGMLLATPFLDITRVVNDQPTSEDCWG